MNEGTLYCGARINCGITHYDSKHEIKYPSREQLEEFLTELKDLMVDKNFNILTFEFMLSALSYSPIYANFVLTGGGHSLQWQDQKGKLHWEDATVDGLITLWFKRLSELIDAKDRILDRDPTVRGMTLYRKISIEYLGKDPLNL
jgi:hypothetical protein